MRVVREDLATDYQALADRHLEEVAQIQEEYSAVELEIAHQLQKNEVDRQATGQDTIETMTPGQPSRGRMTKTTRRAGSCNLRTTHQQTYDGRNPGI